MNVVTSHTPPASTAGAFLLLEPMRGLAALSVMAFHASILARANADIAADQSGLAAFASYGRLGVSVFFVVSGYCIAAAISSAFGRGEGYGRYLKRRIRRIYPTYWASLLLVLAIALAAMAVSHSGGAVRSSTVELVASSTFRFWIANLFLIQHVMRQPLLSVVSWSLEYEIAFYLIAGLPLILRAWWQPTAMFIALMVLTVLLAAISLRWALPWPVDAWLIFALGVAVYVLVERNSGWWSRGWAATAVIAMIAASFDRPPLDAPSTATALGTATLLLLIKPCDQTLSRHAITRAFAALGAMSYSLYLTHFAVMGALCQLVRLCWGGIAPATLTALLMIVPIPFAALLHYAVERRFVSGRRVAVDHAAVATALVSTPRLGAASHFHSSDSADAVVNPQ